MKRFVFFLSTLFISLVLHAQTESRLRVSFNKDWSFILNHDNPRNSQSGLDDSKWRKLNLPHDWAIEGEFSKDNPSGTGGGALPGGIGWYRKTFVADASYKGRKVYIDFDGVYMNSEVFINGKSLGKRPYGYISFQYDLTPYLKFGKKNIIAVRVDNSEQPNSRWYSGCGIYRNVWLTVTDPVHVANWGTYVTTTGKGDLHVETTIDNKGKKEITVIQTLLDKAGKLVAQTEGASADLHVSNPILWSIENPYLYTLKTELKIGNRVVDSYLTRTAFRFFEFNATKGFLLNGKQVKINGVCEHHDLGCLGSAINKRALQRQLEILKDMGVNGIRCSHNPPAPELLDLTDEMGFIVMDEAFDMWRKRKTKFDYSRYFPEWHEKDLTDMVLRDRNHPSIFMWSIGNEVGEQGNDNRADTLSLDEANYLLNFPLSDYTQAKNSEGGMGVNSLLTKKLADIVKKLDPTRPVTAGCNDTNPQNNLFTSKALDIIGFNYHNSDCLKAPENFPGKPFIITESVSGLATRGYYRMPSDSIYIMPQGWGRPRNRDNDKKPEIPTYLCSSYDNCHVPWGNTQEETWAIVKNNDFISGQYIWTGFDYIGEPTPYGWPARSSYFGVIDLAGFPKDTYYMYQSEWTDKTMLHLLPHWNWEEGQEIDVWAYYNNADAVELFVNGISQGLRSKTGDVFHVCWRVKYEPVCIKAISYKDGKKVMEKEIHTAGEPAKIRLTADRKVIKANGEDMSFITVEILDKEGNLCPNATNLVNFKVNGNAFIAGVDNGNETSLESFKANNRKAFYGKCLVVLQNNGTIGKATLTAESENLTQHTIDIVSE